ncbi:hypothetical protein [Hankyongella ginsenosidimutans]|uniref:hypothetical protein n=1 Tax=Hankyongella ginsenosidimutans TaxID=1763828 RepID=UPI001FEB104A|nr:hypothetical protein [Hankyongella ginsenosidimutans]
MASAACSGWGVAGGLGDSVQILDRTDHAFAIKAEIDDDALDPGAESAARGS